MNLRETHYISSASDIEEVAGQLFACEFIGVYWTLPAAGRGELPDEIEGAARASFTIEQQRKVISQVAARLRLSPLNECALQFSSGLAWTEGLDGRLEEALKSADPDTVLMSVDFQPFGWRTHHALRHRLLGTKLAAIRVSADLCMGVVDHFSLNRHWDDRHKHQRKERRSGLKLARFQPDRERLRQFHDYIRQRIATIDEWPDWSLTRKAEALNARGLWTVSGLRWSAESIRDLEAVLFET